MFGRNPLRKADAGDGATLWVQEVFGTIQGEGPFSGLPAIFVRLAGCNLRCHFCDTDFESSEWRPTLDDLFAAVEAERTKVKTNLIVITGGEPLRQPVGPFITSCLDRGLRVQIETAGTVWPATMRVAPIDDALSDGRITIVCSPKTTTLNSQVKRHTKNYKYIVAANEVGDDGLPALSTQSPSLVAPIFVPKTEDAAQIWLQPRMDYLASGAEDVKRTAMNTKAAADLCMKHGYRLSLQIHKTVGLR